MWSELVRAERRLAAVGVDDDVVALEAEEELLEHRVRVGRDAVRPHRLHGADRHPRNDVLGQQGAARGLRALDRLAVGRALRELPHVRARLVLRVRGEVGAVLVAQRVAEDQHVERRARVGRELAASASHRQPHDRLPARRGAACRRPPRRLAPRARGTPCPPRCSGPRRAAPPGPSETRLARIPGTSPTSTSFTTAGEPPADLPGLERDLHERGRGVRGGWRRGRAASSDRDRATRSIRPPGIGSGLQRHRVGSAKDRITMGQRLEENGERYPQGIVAGPPPGCPTRGSAGRPGRAPACRPTPRPCA